jgi:CheY-like chemotaxis protein
MPAAITRLLRRRPRPGATFARDQAAASDAGHAHRLDPATDRRVLVAEDNLINQLIAVRLLEKQGFRVEVASTGREAVRMHDSAGYDLILMDCQMPELDGYAATAEIRRGEPPGTHIPIIAVTANAPEGERERCLAAGMDEYVAKPLSMRTLPAIIARAFVISAGEVVT